MPYVMMGGMMVLQSIMGANAAGSQAQQQITQQSWTNHVGNMQNDQQNRDIASANAQQWMNNRLITESANKTMAEEQVYLQYNYDNATGELSRQTAQQNDALISGLSNRNMKGGTARALMRMQRTNQAKVFQARSISHGNKMRDSERRRDAALSQRNFSYNKHNVFVGGRTFTDPSKAHKNALMTGLIGAGMGMYTGYQEEQQWQQQLAGINAQTAWYTNNPGGGSGGPMQMPAGGGPGW